MNTYSANITNSDAYWTKRRYELLATIEQRGLPTLFFTFSFADTHWKDLHRLMPGGQEPFSQRYKNVLNNPHLADWYYSYRLTEFVRVFFDKILKCEWIYYRHERQSRDAIHTHGVCKLSNDPGIACLTTVVYKGMLKRQMFPLNSDVMPKYNEFLEIIKDGDAARARTISALTSLD